MASPAAVLSSAPGWRVSPGVLVALLAALGFAGWAMFEPRLFNDGDTGWHLATARWMFANGRVPTSDPFSWTALGKPWQAHEWLAEVLLGLGERLAGWRGVALVPGLAIGAMVAIVGTEAARWLDWRKLVIAQALVIGALLPFCLARPHVIAWPLLAGWTVLLLRAREEGRAPPLAAVLVMLVWANLHASWLLGLGIAGVFGLEALIAGPDRRGVLIGWGSFGLLSGLAVLLTPQGVEGVIFPFYVSGMQALDIIAEWRPTSFVRYPAFEAWLLALVAVALWRGVRVPVLRLALIVGLMHLAFQHERHQAVLVIVATLLMARPIGEGFARPAPGASLPLGWLPPLLLVGLLAARLAIPADRPETRANPARAIAAVPPDLRIAPVFNSYSIGGTLIFHGIRPFVDGRADLYGDALVKDFWTMHQGDLARFRSVAAARDIRWTILERKAPLARALDREPGWKRLYADRFAVVHVRQP